VSGTNRPGQPPKIRLVFQLERAEMPRLYDELIRFAKGTKRVGRLRTLAYDGLLVHEGVMLPSTLRVTPPDTAESFDGDRAGVMNDLFAPAIDAGGSP